MHEQPELPIEVRIGIPNTLDPLRRAIESAEKDAKAACRAIQDHDDLGWIWEELDPLDKFLWRIGNSAECLRDEARKARRLKDGYDTWPGRKLEKHIRLLLAAADAFQRLYDAHVRLRAAELAELQRQGVSPTLPPA